MAATKSLSVIIAAGTSNAAASTTTGTVVNMTTAYGAEVTIKLTNGATAPTFAPVATVYISGDNVNFKKFYQIGGDLVINSVNEFAIDIPASVMYLRVDVGANTGQAVTCEAFAQVLVSV